MASNSVLSIPDSYVELALAIEQHIPGYIDAYYGPIELRQRAESAGKLPIGDLAKKASNLRRLAQVDASLGTQRQDFLSRQLRAMETTLGILQGEKFSLVEEVDRLYDVTPQWTSEIVLEEAHRVLDNLLPPGNSLIERMLQRNHQLEVAVEHMEKLLHQIIDNLRARTQWRPLFSSDEHFEIHLVNNQPWGAYNWYLGNGHSRIDVNTDLPLCITTLVDLMAHEGYPGHHTERSIKDNILFRESGQIEHCVVLINSPECVVSEGIATLALETIMSLDELIAWQTEVLFPQAGFDNLNAQNENAIERAKHVLDRAKGNAVFMMYEEGSSEGEVASYLCDKALVSEGEAHKIVDFMKDPLFRSYFFTYLCGQDLLEDLFQAKGSRSVWFERLLREPVTPSQIRRWTAEKD
jgi:hypothetical protein